jgi:photosystem II stability/assembly factor-like uncharacterized protein
MFAVSPDFAADDTLYFGTRRHGVFKSVDGGRNASVIWRAKRADGSAALITSLVISPNYADDGTLFAGVYGQGVYKTEDKGKNWRPVNQGLAFVDTWQSLAGDNGQSARYALESQHVRVAVSSGYGADQTVFAASGDGLFKTTDGAGNWQELHSPAYGQDPYVVELAISPDYESDHTLIVSVKGKGLYKSEDGGATFDPIGSGLIGDNHQITLIEFSPAYAANNTIYAASDEELFRSTDGGETWQIINRPVRYEDMRQVLRYNGQWHTAKGDNYSAKTVAHSDVAGSKANLQFVGTGISWLGMESNDGGIARVFIDGTYVGDVDQFGPTEISMVRSFSVTDLAYGPHTITVEASGQKNPESAGYRIYVDAFDVLGTSPTQ